MNTTPTTHPAHHAWRSGFTVGRSRPPFALRLIGPGLVLAGLAIVVFAYLTRMT
jgi:uncharacterized protein YjeT (DUF2065 family)